MSTEEIKPSTPGPAKDIESAEIAPKVDLDLDALEREDGTAKPFRFTLGGYQFLLSDPKEVDWQDLLSAMQNPVMFFQFTLPPDDHRRFFGSKLPAWKMNRLIKEYQEHYGLPSVGEASGLRV